MKYKTVLMSAILLLTACGTNEPKIKKEPKTSNIINITDKEISTCPEIDGLELNQKKYNDLNGYYFETGRLQNERKAALEKAMAEVGLTWTEINSIGEFLYSGYSIVLNKKKDIDPKNTAQLEAAKKVNQAVKIINDQFGEKAAIINEIRYSNHELMDLFDKVGTDVQHMEMKGPHSIGTCTEGSYIELTVNELRKGDAEYLYKKYGEDLLIIIDENYGPAVAE